VLTVCDVVVPKRSAQQLHLAKDTETLMAAVDQPMVVLDAGLRVQAGSSRFLRMGTVSSSSTDCARGD
jgi:hypothetical protein